MASSSSSSSSSSQPGSLMRPGLVAEVGGDRSGSTWRPVELLPKGRAPGKGPVFRRARTFNFDDWNVDVDRSYIVASSNGGAIAVSRKIDDVVKLDASNYKLCIDIYSAAGVRISSLPLDQVNSVVGMGWTEDEELVAVFSPPSILVVTVFGEHVSDRKLEEIEGVRDCRFWSHGVVLMTLDFKLYDIQVDRGFVSPPALLYGSVLDREKLNNWAIIDPKYSSTRGVEVILLQNLGGFITIAAKKASPVIGGTKFSYMVTSPFGPYLACLAGPSAYFGDLTFQNLTAVPLPPQLRPRQIVCFGTKPSYVAYCSGSKDGPSTVVILAEGQEIVIEYKEPVVIASEIDGVRVISRNYSEFIYQLSEPALNACDPSRLAPAHILVKAYESFLLKKPQVWSKISSIRGDLLKAVNDCIEATGFEFDPADQQFLLKAASFGRNYIDFGFDANKIVEKCKWLRILNSVREKRVGMSITFTQLESSLTIQNLLMRLCSRREHLLAFNVAQLCSVPANEVLEHWARAKILASGSDDVADVIRSKFSLVPRMSYINIAKFAQQIQRTSLATKLSGMEKRIGPQVDLLLQLDQFDAALERAAKSGDLDAVFKVFKTLHQREREPPFQKMFSLIEKNSVEGFFLRFCRDQAVNPVFESLLRTYYTTRGKMIQATNEETIKTLAIKDVDRRVEGLQRCVAGYGAILAEKGPNPRVDFTKRAMESQTNLLLIQRTYRNETGVDLVGQNLHNTLAALIQREEMDRAEQLRRKLHVPDTRYWCIVVQALGKAKKFALLKTFSDRASSPIGYSLFVEVCAENDAPPDEVRRYFSKVKDESERFECAMKLRDVDTADAIAKKLKDREKMAMAQKLRAKLNPPSAAR